MLRILRVCLALAVLCCALALLAHGQEGVEKKSPTDLKAKPILDPKTGVGDGGGKRIPLDKLKLPPNTIVVICDNIKEALQLYPSMVMLSREKFTEMNDRIAALERLLKPERKLPHTCKLHATVKGDVLDLRADLYFSTEQARQMVFLGCRGAQANQATLKTSEDMGAGTITALDYSALEGYTLQVEKAGNYHLQLRLEVPIGTGVPPAGSSDRSFELGLPGAAVTKLTLDLAQPVKEIRWNKATKKLPPGLKQKHWEETLGPLKQLAVAWKETQGPSLKSERVAMARNGQILVKVDTQEITTVAELVLQDWNGQTQEWQLWLPPKATVKVTPPEGVSVSYQPPLEKPVVQLHKLKLDKATDEAIKVTVTVTTPRIQGRVPIGPFGVVEALRQDGTIEVRATAAARRGMRLNLLVHGDLEERDLPKELAASDVVARFHYANMPIPSRPLKTNDAVKHQAPLEIELKAIKGAVETLVEHNLSLKPTEQGLQVVAKTTIQAKPLHAPVDFLDVQLLPRQVLATSVALFGGPNGEPFPGCLLWPGLGLVEALPLPAVEWKLTDSSTPAELLNADPDGKKKGHLRIKLEKHQEKSFTIKLTGTYLLPPGTRQTRLALPKPLTSNSRGQVRVEVENELELLVRQGGVETPAPQRHFYTFESEPAPEVVDLAWRPYRPELPVRMVADVTLRSDIAHVRQQLEFTFGPRQLDTHNPRKQQILLRVSEQVRELRVLSGGRELPSSFNQQRPKTAYVTLTVDPGAKLVLEYEFVLPALAKAKPEAHKTIEVPDFSVPLLWPEQATRMHTKVRLWCDANTLPTLADPQDIRWQDLGTEIVAGADRLPRRVLSCTRLEAPLKLNLEITPPDREARVERTLVQVAVDDEGTEHYRVRFLFTELHTTTLKLKLPVPLAGLPQITWGQKKVLWHLVDNGSAAQIIGLPPLDTPSVLLEVTYQLPRDHLHDEGAFQTNLHAPGFVGNVIVQQVRWQVSLPNGVLPLVVGENANSQHQWMWRGWLLTPQPALTSSQLEQWLTAPPSDDPPVTPSLVLGVGSSRVDLQACKLEYSIVSPK